MDHVAKKTVHVEEKIEPAPASNSGDTTPVIVRRKIIEGSPVSRRLAEMAGEDAVTPSPGVGRVGYTRGGKPDPGRNPEKEERTEAPGVESEVDTSASFERARQGGRKSGSVSRRRSSSGSASK